MSTNAKTQIPNGKYPEDIRRIFTVWNQYPEDIWRIFTVWNPGFGLSIILKRHEFERHESKFDRLAAMLDIFFS